MKISKKSLTAAKSLVKAAEKYKKLFQDPEVVETFKELGHDVQNDLTVIEKESKKIISKTKQERAGFFVNIIAYILKFLYAGKAKALYNQLNNDPKLIESNKKLEQARANYIKTISDPSVKEVFRKYGYDVEKDFPPI